MLANTLLSVPSIASTVQRVGSQVTSIATRMDVIDSHIEVLTGLVATPPAAPIPILREFKVSTAGFAYNIEGFSGDHPSLYILNGFTYAFTLNLDGAHPLMIRDSFGNQIVDGMKHVGIDGVETVGASANSGRTTGTLYWTPSYVVTGDYRYQCVNHASMVGSIVVKNITLL